MTNRLPRHGGNPSAGGVSAPVIALLVMIHPTALIHSSADIATGVTIGPYTTVQADVKIGAGSKIGAYVTLGERLSIGRKVRVFNYACLGTESQDKKHRGEVSWAEIGDGTTVREFVTVNRATREGGVTRVGRDVLLMAYSHVAHEGRVGDGAVLVNGATLGGEVVVEPGAIVSGLVCVHQHCRIGRHAFIGANSKVTLDIPPFVLADGHPAHPYGPNVVGLRRAGFASEQILEIRRVYRRLFDRRRPLAENLGAVVSECPDSPIAAAIVEFCRAGTRGIARPRSRVSAGEPGWDLELDAAAAESGS